MFAVANLSADLQEADVDMSRIPEQGAHSPSWPNGRLIIIMYSPS